MRTEPPAPDGHFNAPCSAAVDTWCDLTDFVSDITIIAQSQCERATDYEDIETLVCHLPIAQYTFAAHDLLAPHSGPYPMAILVRAFLIEKVNSWDETTLHNHLHVNTSLRRDLGFESLPAQSTFWRAWNIGAARHCATPYRTVPT